MSTCKRATRSAAIMVATSVSSPDCVDSYAAAASVREAVGRNVSASSASGIAVYSAMVRPANVTFNASGRSPEPSHIGHSTLSTNCKTRRRIMALSAGERAVVVIIGLHGVLARIDFDCRLLIGEQNPIALTLREFAPWLVD